MEFLEYSYQKHAENFAKELADSDYAMLMCGIFKKSMSMQTHEIFITRGWAVKDLERNPYVAKYD